MDKIQHRIDIGRMLKTTNKQNVFALLEEGSGDLAHSKYNAYLRRMVSFADACPRVRRDRRRA